ncbi:MAG: gliding motility-associated C-terminal domain-containing protein, partial [Saprospiraceae bacterium]|nr:gliding motility-associated C-terminal domain-containing protein [Saprospiraceae bacterium]
ISCAGKLFDSGGSAGDYSNNENIFKTLCPDGSNTHLLLQFDSLVLAPGDQLCFHDGANALAPVLACAADFPNSNPIQIQASASNASGCLTLVFISDGTGTAAGWSASLSCAAPCVVPGPGGVVLTQMNGGQLRWAWDAVPGSSGFQVRVNGGSWGNASAPQAHTVSGLSAGDPVTLDIRPISDNPGCSAGTATVSKIYAACTLSADLVSQTPATCPGTSTGSALINASGGMGAVQFFVDNNPAPFTNGTFNNFFAAGNHQVIAVDTAGCRDTVLFTITEPPPIAIALTVTDAKCFGDNSGIMQATVSGGTPGYSYAWRNCQGGPILTGPTIPDLFAGCYGLTITDSKGCTAVAQDTVGEPPKFQFMSVQDSVRCFGGMDGRGTVFVSGAMPPYSYLWGNGDTTPTADSLKAAFHSVTITDAVGCQAVTLVQVLQPSRLIIDSLTTTPIACFGINTGTASAFAHGGVKPYAYAWNNALMGQTIQNLGPGTYTVTLTDFKGCTALASTQLPAPPELLTNLSVIQSESCAGACDGSLSVNPAGGAPPYTVAWDSPAIPPGALSPNQLCPGVYRVTVTDAEGCTQTGTASIQAAVAISLQFEAAPPSCAGSQNGELSVAAAGGAAPFQYNWNTGATGGTITNLNCGTYTVTATDARGCTLTASESLACPPVLLIDSIQPTPVRCFGEANGQVQVFASGGSGTLTYFWSDPNQQFDPNAVNLPPGTYTVTVTDQNNCTVSASATVSEPPPLVVGLQSTAVRCFGETNGSATATVSGGVMPYQYSWNVPGDSSTISGLPAGTYSVTVTDAYGCPSANTSILVNQPATPVQLSVEQTRQACYDLNNGAGQAIASGSNGGPFGYAWSNGATVPMPVNFSSGTYTVTATDNKGCSASQTVTIAEWDSIHVNVAFILPTCPGASDGQAAVNLVSGGAGNGTFASYSYQWSVPGASDTIYVSGLLGNKNYGLTVTDQAGCSAAFSFFMSDQIAIVPFLQADSVSCFGLADGAIRLTGMQSPRPITQYAWSNGAGSPSLTDLPAAVYILTATDNKGCSGTASATVYQPAALNLKLQVQALLCNDDLNASIAGNVTGGTSPYQYFWNTGSTNKQLTNLGPGLYALTVTDHNGCTISDSTLISQPNPPDIQVESKGPSCAGARDGTARILVGSGAPPYRYSLDGQNYSGSSYFLGLAAGNYTAHVLDAQGCVTTISFSLTEPPAVVVELGPDLSIELGEGALLVADVFNAVGQASFSWNSGLIDSLACADTPLCSSIWVYPEYSNVYTVRVSDENGCRAQASVRVKVEKPRGVYVPTGFSPNSDGNNDRLVVYGKSQQVTRIVVFRVYDRWGELVYEDADFKVNDEQRGWNGQFRDSDAQTGVYVWYLEAEYRDGFTQILRGNTTLIR